MKPETLEALKLKIRDVPDDSLTQFLRVILDEIQSRKRKRKQLQRYPESPWKKACEPIRGY